MARPVIALLTDFGTRDHYAATMKGVVLGICPDATLVDISHEVPAHDVTAGGANAHGVHPLNTEPSNERFTGSGSGDRLR